MRTVYAANIDKKVEREDVRAFFESLCGKFGALCIFILSCKCHCNPTWEAVSNANSIPQGECPGCGSSETTSMRPA